MRFAVLDEDTGALLAGAKQGQPPAWVRPGEGGRWWTDVEEARRSARGLAGMGYRTVVVELLENGFAARLVEVR